MMSMVPEQLMEICRMGFWVSLVIMLMAAVLALFFYMRFHIRQIFPLIYGHGEARIITNLDEAGGSRRHRSDRAGRSRAIVGQNGAEIKGKCTGPEEFRITERIVVVHDQSAERRHER